MNGAAAGGCGEGAACGAGGEDLGVSDAAEAACAADAVGEEGVHDGEVVGMQFVAWT